MYLGESACAAVRFDFAVGEHIHGVEQGLTCVKWATLGLARVRFLFSEKRRWLSRMCFCRSLETQAQR